MLLGLGESLWGPHQGILSYTKLKIKWAGRPTKPRPKRRDQLNTQRLNAGSTLLLEGTRVTDASNNRRPWAAGTEYRRREQLTATPSPSRLTAANQKAAIQEIFQENFGKKKITPY